MADLTQFQFDSLKEALEEDFRTLALNHETAIADAVKFWQGADQAKTGALPLEADAALAKAQQQSRFAAALKAIMILRFPDASEVWFKEAV